MYYTVLYYVIIGFIIATMNGNLDSKYDQTYKTKSVLYWPVYAINYFNATSNINQVDVEKVKRELIERRLKDSSQNF